MVVCVCGFLFSFAGLFGWFYGICCCLPFVAMLGVVLFCLLLVFTDFVAIAWFDCLECVFACDVRLF